MNKPKLKNIQFQEPDYDDIVEAARQAGYKVKRGRGSQLSLFVKRVVKKFAKEEQKDE